ncbi:hypothetical protein CVV65_10790 [Kyrpidia spormannii]|uniref:Uncharacterized protein n=1 Tax=Kyrpidia spormannii TaxID=2055160 RepID=A0A2K8N951_9BACL|nr:hypothetical protein [Kyrpidia spormannii]ATY85347.1 hypothetical protein CVV65_10790 [Kyrpidia spormannii]
MKKAQWAVAILSAIVALAALVLWEWHRLAGQPVPLYVWVMAAYGWTFVIGLGVDRWARGVSRRRGIPGSRPRPKPASVPDEREEVLSASATEDLTASAETREGR